MQYPRIRFEGMVCKGWGCCRYVLGILLMAHGWPRPLTSGKGKESNFHEEKQECGV